jgi:hypothetical protein
MPVTTAARTITDIKGQKSQPSKKADTRKRARKNHKIILGEVLSCIIPQIEDFVQLHGNREKMLSQKKIHGIPSTFEKAGMP